MLFQFDFMKDCGNDDFCLSQLEVSVDTPKSIILGDTHPLVLDIKVLNKGEHPNAVAPTCGLQLV
jgi:hypothetical protein